MVNKSSRIITSITSILFVYNSNAQRGFGLRPIVEISFGSFYSTPAKIYTSGAYSFQKMFLTHDKGFPSFSLGLMANVKMKNNIVFEIGVSQDETNTGHNIYFTNYQQRFNTITNSVDTIITPNHISSSGGIATTRFPLFVYLPLFNPDSIKLSCKIQFLAGVNFIYQPRGNPSLPLFVSGFDSILLYPNYEYMSYDTKLFATGKCGSSFSAGFDFEFIRKNRNLFSISIYYNQGAQTLSKEQVKITINNNTFFYYLYSRGSGLYVRLSKNFNLQKKFTKAH